MDAYERTAGMWLVGEDLPQESNAAADSIHGAAGPVSVHHTPPYPSTHNLGTCRMSERPEDGVVDRWGKAHDAAITEVFGVPVGYFSDAGRQHLIQRDTPGRAGPAAGHHGPGLNDFPRHRRRPGRRDRQRSDRELLMKWSCGGGLDTICLGSYSGTSDSGAAMVGRGMPLPLVAGFQGQPKMVG